jgi:transcriptional regulator with XRE-family HTH domain
MGESLHSANPIASAKVCWGDNASRPAFCHKPSMAKGVPNRIRYWRQQKGWTLQQLGDALEPPASKGTVSAIESETRGFSLERLLDFAKALGVSPGAVLDGPPKVPTANELEQMLEIAQRELPMEMTRGDYPRAVASSLLTQLALYAGVRSNSAGVVSETSKRRDKGAQPPPATKRSEPAARRTA